MEWLTFCVSLSVIFNSLRPHRLQPSRLLCPWDSPGKNTGVGSHSLLQGIFPTQELNLGLLHCRWILYCLSQQGSCHSDLVFGSQLSVSLVWFGKFVNFIICVSEVHLQSKFSIYLFILEHIFPLIKKIVSTIQETPLPISKYSE